MRNQSEVVDRLETKLSESDREVAFFEDAYQREQDRVNHIKSDCKTSVIKKSKKTVWVSREILKMRREQERFQLKHTVHSGQRFRSEIRFRYNLCYCFSIRNYGGLSKYIAVGNDQGRVYIFSRNKDVLIELYTVCDSPVAAIISYLSVYKNENIVEERGYGKCR